MYWIEQLMLAAFFLCTVISAFLVYRAFTTEFRSMARTKIQKILEERRKHVIEKSQDSRLEKILQELGNPLGLNAIRFQVLRFGFFLFLVIHYVVYPYLMHRQVSYFSLAVIFLAVLMTSPEIRFSVTNVLLSRIKSYRMSQMNSELFLLYDMIQAELSNLGDQEVNTYSLLMDMQAYFSYIRRPLSKMILRWKSSASIAAKEFYTAIPTPEARLLTDILVKMDRTKCMDALVLIQGLQESFTDAYVENMKRKKEALDLVLNIPVFGSQWIIFGNLLIVMYLMISDLIDFTNLPMS